MPVMSDMHVFLRRDKPKWRVSTACPSRKVGTQIRRRTHTRARAHVEHRLPPRPSRLIDVKVCEADPVVFDDKVFGDHLDDVAC